MLAEEVYAHPRVTPQEVCYDSGQGNAPIVKGVERFRTGRKDRLNLKRLIVEWGALGLPTWTIGRRSKIRHETTRTLERVKKKHDLTTTPAMYAALTYVEEHDVDLKAIVERDFGAAPKRAKMWRQKAQAHEKNGWNPWKDDGEDALEEGSGV